MPKTKCKICSSNTVQIFQAEVLGKYSTAYFQCENCKFIQTEQPHWLDEAYSSAITDLDIGLVWRNIRLSKWLEVILTTNFSPSARYLDYAGGYGLLVRIMRDKGFDFFREDRYCENLFARHFDVTDLPRSQNFELLTAFEVFEHLIDPLADITEMLNYSDNIIFSTELQPNKQLHSSTEWWYFAPETGQHIAFYTKEALQALASQHGCTFYTNGQLHIISKDKNAAKLFDCLTDGKHEIPELGSGLLQKDFAYVHAILKERQLIEQPFSQQKEQKIDPLTLLIDELAKIKVLSYQSEETTRVISENLATSQNELKELAQDLQVSHKHVGVLTQELQASREQVGVLTQELQVSHKQIGVVTQKLQASREQVGVLTQELQASQDQVGVLTQDLQRAQSDIERMQSTKIWKAAEKVRKNPLVQLLKPSQEIKQHVAIIQKKQAKHNKKSKRLFFVGHSYHKVTQSSSFFLDILKKQFEVITLFDESWNGGSPPSFGELSEKDLGVVFWQYIPQLEVLEGLRNNNVTFAPMYDASGGASDEYWLQYPNVKFINFSSTLHNKITSLGLRSTHLQYFPKPHPSTPTNNKTPKVFFWQRTDKITIHTVEKLLGKTKAQIHIHRAVDPGFTFVQPTKAQEKKYAITYSDWFKTKREMTNILQQCDIYIAPREYEGIGLSFLEAMAMSKVVIAPNNPTMNEYIAHGETGLLYNITQPSELDLTKINSIRETLATQNKLNRQNWIGGSQLLLSTIQGFQ